MQVIKTEDLAVFKEKIGNKEVVKLDNKKKIIYNFFFCADVNLLRGHFLQMPKNVKIIIVDDWKEKGSESIHCELLDWNDQILVSSVQQKDKST